MIRINLLPFRAAKRRENIRRQVSIYILVAIFLIMAIAYFTLDLNSQLAAAKSKENTLKQEQAKYVKISKKIQQLKQNTERTTSKLKVIKGLEKKKMGPFQLLSEIAWAVPTDKLWLSSLKEQGGDPDPDRHRHGQQYRRPLYDQSRKNLYYTLGRPQDHQAKNPQKTKTGCH